MRLILLLFTMFTILVVGCTSIPRENSCATAADCVPASCCHAGDAVNKGSAPDCAEMLCTAVCEPGTLDCNQGEIRCLQGTCTVVMNE